MLKNINALVLDKTERNKQYYSNPENKESIKARARKYYAEHKQNVLDRIKIRYRDNPEIRSKNQERYRKWKQDHVIDARAHGLAYYYRNRQMILKKHQDGLRFIDKYVHIGFNPRRGTCSQCGFQGYTHIHHTEYDEKHPLAHTVELCAPCHSKITAATTKLKKMGMA